MTTPPIGVTQTTGNTGGAAGTLLGSQPLQTSIDTLNTSIGNLINSIGTLGTARQNAQTQQQQSSGGNFPPPINPFSNNNQSGGNGGNPNIASPSPLSGGFATGVAGAGALGSAVAGYGNQQLPIQLSLNAYATQAAMAAGQASNNFTQQYKTAFGYQNNSLNFLASSPMDAITGTQMLNYVAGNPNFRSTSIGRAGFGYTAGFGMANPLASMQTSAGFAQQMLNPQLSQMMMAMGYPVTPRALGGGPAPTSGAVIQGMIRAWYGQKDVNPSTLTAGLGLGGRANLNLTALGLDPTAAAPVFEEYNTLFRKGLSASEAQKLINQASSGNLATARSAQERLSRLGVKTATSSAQAMRNNQAVLTGRDADIASGFSRGLQEATGLLSRFNQALSHLMTTLHLNGPVGFAGGFGSILSGANTGNMLLGGGGITGLISSILPGGIAGSIGKILGLSGGGIIPGYQPGKDSVPAMLSRGEAVLNPDAANAIGHGRINALNAMYSAPGAQTKFHNGMMYAAAGGTPGGNSSGYMNPFRRVSNLTPERIDAGVDYSGTGPVYALGPGVITMTNVNDPGGWGRYFVDEKLTSGPLAGKYVYVAEGITPRVKVGQKVTSNTVIGFMNGGIETGYNQPGTDLPVGQFNGTNPTAAGVAYNSVLTGLGAPSGTRNGPVTGSVGGGWNLQGSQGSGGSPTGQSPLGIGTVGGVGFNESSLISTYSELGALMGGGFGGGSGTMGSQTSNGTSGTTSSNGGFSGVSGSGGTKAQNKALMKRLAAKYGWGSGSEWQSLDTLEMHEAGYNQFAQNPSSTAYGIGQFLNTTWAGFGPKTSDPRLQEIYMLEYIKQRYGDPNKAWAQYYQHPGGIGWYGEGGSPPDNSIGIVGDRGPEVVNFGLGGGVISNSRTADLLRGNSAMPAQSPWTTINQAGGSYTQQSHNIGPIHLNFNKESVIIKVDGATDASYAGTQAAKSFIKYLADEELYEAIGTGNKNGVNYG